MSSGWPSMSPSCPQRLRSRAFHPPQHLHSFHLPQICRRHPLMDSLLSSTVLVWVQDNVGWGISFAIPVLLMASFLAVFIAGSRVYRFRPLGVSPLTRSLSQVVVASVGKWHLQLPDDSSLLYEELASCTVPSWASSEAAGHKIKHTDQFRFFDKAAVVSPPSSSSKGVPAPVSPWRLCTVTQVEELKMLLRMSPIWLSLVLFFSVSSQMTSTLLEQGMAMDNHVGWFAIPLASLSTFHKLLASGRRAGRDRLVGGPGGRRMRRRVRLTTLARLLVDGTVSASWPPPAGPLPSSRKGTGVEGPTTGPDNAQRGSTPVKTTLERTEGLRLSGMQTSRVVISDFLVEGRKLIIVYS